MSKRVAGLHDLVNSDRNLISADSTDPAFAISFVSCSFAHLTSRIVRAFLYQDGSSLPSGATSIISTGYGHSGISGAIGAIVCHRGSVVHGRTKIRFSAFDDRKSVKEDEDGYHDHSHPNSR